MKIAHTSVLLDEILQIFKNKPLRLFIDATLGAGGHSEAILNEHPEIELLIGIDQDPIASEMAQKRLSPWKNKIKIVEGNFSKIENYLETFHLERVDGILFDLGVSSMQFDLPEKGFSFMRDGPLDMRMDPNSSLTAKDIINFWSEQELGWIFKNYGEEKRWKLAAKAIIFARKQKPIHTTFELVEVLKNVLKPSFKDRIHPHTLIFQALRLAVNNELEVLEQTLPLAIKFLAREGRLAVISFHSLEDRLVKKAFQFAASDKMSTSGLGGLFLDKKPQAKILTNKPIAPNNAEMESNPRSRSAKLRALEKI
jgi:16S rRNA (cytosine1402-N4)-methyltransferase